MCSQDVEDPVPLVLPQCASQAWSGFQVGGDLIWAPMPVALTAWAVNYTTQMAACLSLLPLPQHQHPDCPWGTCLTCSRPSHPDPAAPQSLPLLEPCAELTLDWSPAQPH